MIRQPIFLISVILTISSFQVALAKSLAIDPNARLKAGIHTSLNDYAHHLKNDVSIMPQAFYDNHRWYLEGGEGGGYLYKDTEHHWRATLAYDGRHFNPKNAPQKLQSLNKRRWSAMVGTSYMKITPYGGFKIQLEADLLNRHQGKTVKLAHLSRFQKDQWTIYPEFGVKWYDKKYNQYYYGVSQAEAAATDLTAFQAKSSVNPYALLSVNYQINPRLDGFLSQKIEYLGGNLKHSPMVNEKVEAKTKIGFNYKF